MIGKLIGPIPSKQRMGIDNCIQFIYTVPVSGVVRVAAALSQHS